MNKRILGTTLVMLLALSVVAIGCPPVEVDPAVPVPVPVVIHEWDIQSVMGAGWEAYPPFVRLAEKIYEMSGGQIRITPHPDGAITGPFEVFDAAVGGVLDGFHSWSSYWIGKDPAFVGGPGLTAGFAEDWQLEAWYYLRGGLELMREVYAKFDLFLVGVSTYGAESLHFTKPVDTLEEFRGLLFRTPPGMTSDLFGRLGASIVILPGGEIYLALDKGIIDGTEFMPMAIMYDLGIHEVAPYFVAKGFHMPTAVTNFVVRMDRWEALTPDLQAIVENAVRVWSTDQWFTSALANLDARDGMLAAGNTELFFTAEDRATVRREALVVWETWAERSPETRVIIESQIAFMRELGLIE
jgi:TRAP-type mannitol/chloroaromatic compound transport system substrate-binding protein